MKAYVINLDSRPDRWATVLTQTSLLNTELIRVPAVTTDDLTGSDRLYAAPGVAATWKSHQKAMSCFLDSGDEFGLILEDDFLIHHRKFFSSVISRKWNALDFLQLGYLITSPFQLISIKSSNTIDMALRVVGKLLKFPVLANLQFGHRQLFRERRGLPFQYVPADIRAGAHAYIVSQNFARAALALNSPPSLSTDAVYMSLGWMRNFKMFRLRQSLVKQSNSPTSVTVRSREN